MDTYHGTTGGYTNHSCRCTECKQAWAAYQRRNYRARVIENQKLIERLKSKPCSKCKGTFHFASMHFHHRDPGSKKHGAFNPNASRETILKEIEKCDLVCANCHCFLHWEERQP